VNSAALRNALAPLNNALTTDAISTLNLEVTAQKKQPAAVAEAWLRTNHLI